MRRTKEEAERTRRRIIAAALREFHRRGIARTTIAQIARAAGISRGAVYWHFAGKLALFRAIRESVSLPLLDRSDLTLLRVQDADPLECVAAFLKELYRGFEQERATRITYEIMSFKCEYVAELAGERQALIVNSERLRNALESAYAQARTRGLLRDGVTPRIAALETIAFVSGLMRLSLLDNGRIGMRRDAALVIDAHVDARRVRLASRATATARERHGAGAGRDGTVATPPRPSYLRIVSGK